LRKHGLKGRNVTLKLRQEGFQTFTRAKTLAERTNFAQDIYQVVQKLAEEFLNSKKRIRLLLT
jgi:DNA polymerase-4